MQLVNQDNCPETRTWVVDKRDNKTYYIQKIGTNCWMTTSLAYTGGGDNTYSDVIPTGDGSTGTLSGPDNSGSYTYTLAKYYAHPDNANPTTNPTLPSTATDGGANTATRQFGYLYNWCAAMGGQNTAACAEATTPTPDPNINICPKNWRLPTYSPTNEFTNLNNTVNSGLTNTDVGLRTEWLGQRSGYWNGSFNGQGSYGYYWSSTQGSATGARYLYFYSTNVYPSNGSYKSYGRAVRCVAE